MVESISLIKNEYFFCVIIVRLVFWMKNISLKVEKLGCSRGETIIFRYVDFSLQSGESLIVRGENGVGKSTLLRVIAGLLPNDMGTVSLNSKEFEDVCTACHYFGHQNAMKTVLTVHDNLEFWRGIYGGNGLCSVEALERVGLAHTLHLPFGYLSAGQKRRVAFLKLLVSKRPIWLLDEPTTAMDKNSDKIIGAIMSEHLDSGGIIIAATHQPLQFEATHILDMSVPTQAYEEMVY